MPRACCGARLVAEVCAPCWVCSQPLDHGVPRPLRKGGQGLTKHRAELAEQREPQVQGHRGLFRKEKPFHGRRRGGGEALRFREGQAEGEPGGRGFSCHTESSGRGTLGPSPEAGAQGALNWSRIVLSMLVACSQARERPQAGEPQAGATERAVAGAGWGEGRGGERGLPVTRKGLAGQGLNSRHGEQCRIRGALSQMRLTFLPASGEAC